MDYSKLSDFEINGIVARATQKIGDSTQARGKTLIHDHEDVGEFKNICIGWKEFDPCNNPADAWPIIERNRISLSPFDDFKENGQYMAAKYKPTRDNSKPADVEFWCCDKPLRAAMIVYLMMQDGE